MVVQYIEKKYNQHSGLMEVTFAVDFPTYMNMKNSAALTGHPDTLDYIAGSINMTFYKDRITRALPRGEPPDPRKPDDDIPF